VLIQSSSNWALVSTTCGFAAIGTSRILVLISRPTSVNGL
jgi:hypothetical protein